MSDHHNHSHGHSHVGIDLSEAKNVRSMLFAVKVGIFFNFSIFLADLGIWLFSTESVAILSGSFHNGLHALALTAGYWGISLSRSPPTTRRTYGRKRVQIICSSFIGLLLIATALLMWKLGAERLYRPEEIVAKFIMIMAGVDIASNIVQACLMNRYRGNITIRGIFSDIAIDALASLAVIANGVIILTFGFYGADGIAAIVIGCISLWFGIKILKATWPILTGDVPSHIDLEEVVRFIENFHGFSRPHHMHIWSIDQDNVALSFHVLTDEFNHIDHHKTELKSALEQRFHINHATVEAETKQCSNECEIFI